MLAWRGDLFERWRRRCLVALGWKKSMPATSKSESERQYILFFDGGSRGNPVPGGSGAVIISTNPTASSASTISSSSSFNTTSGSHRKSLATADLSSASSDTTAPRTLQKQFDGTQFIIINVEALVDQYIKSYGYLYWEHVLLTKSGGFGEQFSYDLVSNRSLVIRGVMSQIKIQ
jgi:hypothetical protein